MIYVNEFGPVAHRGSVVWLCVALNDDGHANVRATEDPRQSRDMVAKVLPEGAAVACCASLEAFGRARGWSVQPVPDNMLQLTAQTLVGMENEQALGTLAFTPAADAWLRTSALFLQVQPWRGLSMKPISITLTRAGGAPVTRVAAVGGLSVMPPSCMLLPDMAAWERTVHKPKPILEDVLLCGFDRHQSALSEALERAYARPFHPILMQLRARKPVPLTETELLELAAALGAVSSLTKQTVGRARIDDMEAIATPLPLPSERPS